MKTNVKLLSIALGISCLAIAPVSAESLADARRPGVAPIVCTADNQFGLNRCADNWAKTADFLRSLIYEELNEQLPEPMQSQLAAVEQTWNTFRDTHCKALSEPFRDGSMYPLLYHSCHARVTNDRIADLQGQGNPQPMPADITQRLTTLLNQSGLKNSPEQFQWQRYLKQHCQFEALRFPDRPQQAKQCRDRLEESRIRQIEAMIQSR